MAIRTSDAIVLKRIPLGDTSLLVTVYARELGKIKLVARGARRPKTKMGPVLQPFCLVSVTFNHRENKELQTLSKVESGPFFKNIGEDLNRVGYASAVCELVNKLVLGEEPGDSLFALIIRTLQAIDHLPAESCEVLFWRFQLEFAEIYGTGPEFGTCMGCGISPEETSVRFSPGLGGILCRECQVQDSESMQLSLGTTRLLTRVRQMPLEYLPRLKPVKTSRLEIQRAIRAFYLYQMDDGRELKSLKFLESLETQAREKQ